MNYRSVRIEHITWVNLLCLAPGFARAAEEASYRSSSTVEGEGSTTPQPHSKTLPVFVSTPF